MSLIQKLSTKI